MMTTLWLGALVAFAQDPVPSESTPVEAAAELAKLREAVRMSFLADRRYYRVREPAQRKPLAVARRAATARVDAAVAAYEARSGRKLLHDPEALSVAFAHAQAPVGPPSIEAGEIVTVRDADADRLEYVPTGYDGSRPVPMVWLVSGREQQGDAEAVGKYLADTWREAAERDRVLVVAPVVAKGIDLDALGQATPQSRGKTSRIGAVLSPLGPVWDRLHASRDRMILDCGRGASAFGLRVISRHPDRFAGVVLRWPELDERVRLESLVGTPVLLIRCDATADACEALSERLNAQDPGSCQILTPQTSYPYAGDAGIAAWFGQRRRVAMPTRVVVAPAYDRYRSNRWIRVRKMDPVVGPPWQGAPRVVAEADREANRIVITTRGVQEFELFVGPSLVDVQDFTLVVNGKSERLRLTPSMSFLRDFLRMRTDTSLLYTASHVVSVR